MCVERQGGGHVDVAVSFLPPFRPRHVLLRPVRYDEDRWPSGAAGGLVSKANPEFRAKHLLWTSTKYGDQVPLISASVK
jgi:hypothetical protein